MLKLRSGFVALQCAMGACLAGTAAAQPLTTEFSVQGQLNDAGSPASGLHDFRFRLYDAVSGGGQIGATLCRNDLDVVEGRFGVLVDFGAVFSGQQRFLEIEVRTDTGLDCTDPTGYTTLAPRQALTGVPNALFSLNAANATTATSSTTATNATQLNGQAASFYQNAANLTSGSLPNARLSGTYTGIVNLTNASNTLAGSGANLTALNASNIATGTLGNARTTGASTNTPSTLVLRDVSGGFSAGTISAIFSGDGSALTALNASNISTGTIGNARTTGASTNTPSTLVLRDASGNFSAGTISGTFSGNGSAITALNASNISTGTIANARTTGVTTNTPGTLVLRDGAGGFSAGTISAIFSGDGSALTALNASNISTGTIGNARTTGAPTNTPSTLVLRDASGNFSAGTIAAAFSGNGSAITSLDADNIATGTLAAARLPSNWSAGGDLTGTYPNPAIATGAVGRTNLAPDVDALLGTAGSTWTQPVSGTAAAGTILNPAGIAMYGSYAYVLSSTNAGSIQMYNVTNPLSPVVLTNVSVFMSPKHIAISGGYAYVVGTSPAYLKIYSLSNYVPMFAGSLSLSGAPFGFPTGIAASGSFVYVTDQSGALRVFDVSNPAAPAYVGSVGTTYWPSAVAVSGTFAYVVSDASASLQVYNISNPVAPVLAASVGIAGGGTTITIAGSYAYVGAWNTNSLKIFNVSDPAAPSLVSTTPTGAYGRIAVSGSNVLHTSSTTNTLEVFSVVNPAAPTLVATIATGGFPEGLAMSGEVAFVVCENPPSLQSFRPSSTRSFASDITTFGGSVVGSNFTGTHTGDGSALTTLSAANFTNGVLSDSRLSSNVLLLDTAQTISSMKTFSTAPAFTGAGVPFLVASTSKVNNLNADLLDGLNSTAFLQAVPNPLALSGSSASEIIRGQNNSSTNNSSGVTGAATAATGQTSGVYGVSDSDAGAGVKGEATHATGASFGGMFSNSGSAGGGVNARALGTSGTTYGGYFSNASSSGTGAIGIATSASGATYGLLGRNSSTSGTGVFGEGLANSGTNYGGYFQSSSTSGHGVFGAATAASGSTFGGEFRAASPTGHGVKGWATSTSGQNVGVYGLADSTSGIGVRANATAATGATYGVFSECASTSGYGVYGAVTSATGFNYAGFFTSASSNGIGVYGQASAATGTTYAGRFTADSNSGTGVFGVATSATGATVGVKGETYSTSTTATGVYGRTTATTGTIYGVSGETFSVSGKGVYGYAGASTGTSYGVHGFANTSASGYAVYASGDMGASGVKPFRIDHPDDPTNKYLLHYAAESPEVINFYSETVTLDARGEAVVELPRYFAKINTRPRYQLTPVGAPMPMLHVAEEIDPGALAAGAKAGPDEPAPVCTFRIAGGVAGAKVSWEVKAVRNDLYVQRRGAPVEKDKQGPEIGTYQHPDLYGQPAERGMNYRPEPDDGHEVPSVARRPTASDARD